ncbi:Transcription antiterminator [Phaeobacter piscinae]|uniref:transcription termination/antitermination protein NusG n=1 Tax=Phaeobacter piscinae TaxID=1580596 RepID=UPI000C9D112C|nr:transcription termination/antitermination NusG family protein [Phaeobacter piscinae]AUR35791.1 Transcription antiterminator [Phaeobacter piscinae]
MQHEWNIGDPWPFRSSRGIVGKPCQPVWHALITLPQKEAETARKLENAGCEVQYPTEERVRHVAGKKHVRTAPILPGIIYVKFGYEPHWDVMRRRKVVIGVFSRYGHPVALSGDDVMGVMGLPTQAEQRRAAALAAVMPTPGGRAVLTSGPFSGFMVDVLAVEKGRVWYEMITAIGVVRGEDDSGMVQRVAQ